MAWRSARTWPAKTYAAVPILFALHQGIEGVQWLVQRGEGSASVGRLAAYAYLSIAFLWPFYMPLALALVELNPKRLRILKAMTVAGACFVAFLWFFLLWNGATASVSHHHILYAYDLPIPNGVMRGAYLLLTAAPPFISSARRSSLFGVAVLVTYLAAWQAYHLHLTSVWCFFAALLSLLAVRIRPSAWRVKARPTTTA